MQVIHSAVGKIISISSWRVKPGQHTFTVLTQGIEMDIQNVLVKLQSSKFRSKFLLEQDELDYIAKIGLAKIELHAKEFIQKRLSSSDPVNDGKQTPYAGHPVFTAQHATAICCRSCLSKWHGIPTGQPIDEAAQAFLVQVVMAWIGHQLKEANSASHRPAGRLESCQMLLFELPD